jgi:hypothetical protein
MIRSRTISISVKRKTGDTFDAILGCPKKMMPDAKMGGDGWWSFSTPRGNAKLKFQENKSLGILDHVFIDAEAAWNNSMRVISSGEESEIIITLTKPPEITDEQFNERMMEMEQALGNMKKIIELDS